jgi:hypothetical protein
MDIAYIFYSHSDYSDVWPIMFGQTDKYLPSVPKYFFVDEGYSETGFTVPMENNWTVVLYSDSQDYPSRVSSCLNSVSEEFSIFHHEDMFLLDYPELDLVEELKGMVSEGWAERIQFSRSSYSLTPEFNPGSHRNTVMAQPGLNFCIQPAIQSTNSLKEIYNGGIPGESIWEFEQRMGFVKLTSLMSYHEKDTKAGVHHWNSYIYPYCATAIVKGKWSLKEYPELEGLLKDYSIDWTIRGRHD